MKVNITTFKVSFISQEYPPIWDIGQSIMCVMKLCLVVSGLMYTVKCLEW